MKQDRHFLRLITSLALGLAVSACGGLNADNPAATMQAERAGYVTEATSIAQAAEAQSTQVAGTVVAAQTYTALMEGRNEQLLATLQIAIPPTQALVADSQPGTPGMNPTPAPVGSLIEATAESGSGSPDSANSGMSLGNAQFTQVDTASSIRTSDDCAEELTRTFPADASAVYITTRALNVTQGTQMRVEWFYNGEMAHTEEYIIPRDDDDFCIWFSLVPNDTALSSGNWSVKLYANDQSVDPPQIDFTVGM